MSVSIDKTYLVVENSLFNRTAFLLSDSLTIGTSPQCDITIKDARSDPAHARVTKQDRKVLVEDLGSASGTFLNENRIQEKTVMWEGDLLRCGNVVFRLLNDLPIQAAYDLDDASSGKPAAYLPLEQIGPSFNVKRLEELIPQIPLFKGIGQDAVGQLVRNARLLHYEPGQIIFRQGDSSKSMFIILDGHVEVSFQDYRARKVQVAVLKDNQFFGEMALLSGDPRNATVRAFEASYLCELQPESLRRLIQQYPSVKQTIQAYYNQRMAELSDKKRKAGFVENRNHLRYNLTLPVMIKPHPPQPTDQRQSGRVFRLLTKDVSLSGLSARLKDANDLAIAKLPVGHPISVTLTLPPPFEAIEMQGVIAHIEFPDSANNRACGNVGIKFEGMTAEHVEILSSLLQQ